MLLPAASPSGVRRAAGALVILLGSSAFYLFGILEEPYNSDEGAWMLEAVDVFAAASAGRSDDPVWERGHLHFGFASPTVSKWLMGAGMALAGKSAQSVPRPANLEIPIHRVPDASTLRAARACSAALAGLALGALFLLVSAALPPRVAWTAIVLLAFSPLWIRAARMAMTDAYGVSLSIVAVALFAPFHERLSRSGRSRTAFWCLPAGCAVGLAAGGKLSALGTAAGLGAWLVVEGARRGLRPRGSSASARPWLFAAVMFASVATATFVATYPYLWEDPARRFENILVTWRNVRRSHATLQPGVFRGSFEPGWPSVIALGEALFVPNARVVAAMGLGALVAVGLRLRRATMSEEMRRVAAWATALPAAAIALLTENGVAHSWLMFTALAGGALAIVAAGTGSLRPRSDGPLIALGAAWCGSLAFVVATTTISWARYYLPLLPGLAVVASLAWNDLRESARRAGGTRSARLVDVALAAGLAGIVVAAPRSSFERLSVIAEADAARAPTLLYALAAVALLVATCTALARAARSRGTAAIHAPGPSR